MLDSTIGDITDILDEEYAPEKKKAGLVHSVDEDITLSIAMSSCFSGNMLHNKLLAILVQVSKTVKWYCRVVRLFVTNQMKESSKLEVYSEVLKKFTIACEAFSKNFKVLEEKINEQFEGSFKDHPKYPKFSFWRMFIRIWTSDVHNPLQGSLNKECLRILLRFKQANLIEATPTEPKKEELAPLKK